MIEQLIAGVDFSGSKLVPNQTWLATGKLGGLGLNITDIRQVGSHLLPRELESIGYISALGMDFPFSLPADFMTFWAEKIEHAPFQSWQELVEQLIFTSFDDFMKLIQEFHKESKRVTDKSCTGLAQSPLHRGNPSMVQMTYQGMRLLAGLNPAKFSVLPFHDHKFGTCAVLEVFPRGTLWCLDAPNTGYKSKEKKDADKTRLARTDIIKKLLNLRDRKEEIWREFPRLSLDKRLQNIALESDDALDAVIACYTTAIWAQSPKQFSDPYDSDDESVLLEGWIYAPVNTKTAVAR